MLTIEKLKNFTFQNTVSILYLISGCVWILIADIAIDTYFPRLQNLSHYHLYKSLLYVLMTAIGLYGLLVFLHNKEIKRQKTFTDSILETADVGISVIDKHGVVMQVNQTFADMLDYTRAELLKLHISEILGEFSNNNEPDFTTFMDEFSKRSGSKTIIKKAGKQLQVIVNTHLPDSRDHEKHHVISVTDVTELQQKTKKLEETNRTLESLIEVAPVGIYNINTSGKILGLYNKAAERIMGWSKAEITNHDIQSLSSLFKDQYEHVMRKLHTGKNLEDIELNTKRKDGINIDLRISAAPIPSDNNTVDEIIVILSDITTQKRAQQEIVSSLNEKKFLLQEIHHRVKNNLAIISGLLYLQKTQIENDDAQTALSESQNRINSIANVHELLYESNSFSKISLKEYLSKLIGELKKYSTANGDIAYQIDIPDLKININQAIPFGLIMNELLTNSIKHAFTDATNPEIRIEAAKNESGLHIKYNDNGSGIDGDFNLEHPSGLGFQLIRTSLKQLNADYEMNNDEGFALEFQIPFGETENHSMLN